MSLKRPCLCPNLQNEVSRKQSIWAFGRTVLLQTLDVDAPQVSPAECDSYFHTGPTHCHQPGFHRLPATLRWHSDNNNDDETA